MRTAARLLGVVGALALGAGVSTAQFNTNDMTLSNGGDVIFIFSDPSSGASTGTNPPALFSGDQFWKIYPREALQCASGSILMSGIWETYFDTDWATDDNFYDRIIGNAYELGPLGGTPACARVPSWVALGALDGSEVLISLGQAGLPDPCTVGATCTPGGCAPTGFINGYIISWFGFAIDVTCDGVQDTAWSYFLPGGMTTSATGGPGSCNAGDYVFQTDWSTNETQGDCCGDGVSPFSGLGLGGGFFIDPLNLVPKPNLAFEDNIINIVAQTDLALARESGRNGGGALNGLCLDTTSGQAQLSSEIRDQQVAETGTLNLGITAFSLTRIPAPGIPVLGGQLMIVPDGILNLTIASGTVALVTPVFTPEGIFDAPNIPVPAGTTATFYAQGFVLNLLTLLANETQVWQVTTI